MEYFSFLLKTNNKGLAGWAKLGLHYDKKTDELIKKFNYNSKIFNIIINDLFYKSSIDIDILE